MVYNMFSYHGNLSKSQTILYQLIYARAVEPVLRPVNTNHQRQHKSQCYDDAVIEINGNKYIPPEWSCNRFWSDSILFSESCVARVIETLMLMLGINGPSRACLH